MMVLLSRLSIRIAPRTCVAALCRRELTTTIHDMAVNARGGNGNSTTTTTTTTPPQQQHTTTPPSIVGTTFHHTTHMNDGSPAVALAVTATPKPKAPSATPSLHEFAPKIVVVGVGGAGGNAINHMISSKELAGVDFLAVNTDAQHLSTILTSNRLQLGVELTKGLGCGANPDAGRLAAEECRADMEALFRDVHMVFITAGMGGGTGTGAAPVIADIAYQLGILTVGVVTLPFSFEGSHRKRLALEGLSRLEHVVDTLIVIPNQNLFQLATPETSFVEAFAMADNVLLGGVKSITDLMTLPGIINLDFADVQSVMHGMGHALIGTGQASGENRAVEAGQLALNNPLLSKDMDISTAKGMLVNITGGADMTLFEVDKAAQSVTDRINDENANIIFGSAYDAGLTGQLRVSVVATGIDPPNRM
jgi:cell division protein FtsZ